MDLGRVYEENTMNLHESSSTPFSVNFLESLIFVSLLDHAKGGKQKTEHDGHKAVDRGKHIVEGDVRKAGKGSNTEAAGGIGVEAVDEVLRYAEVATNLWNISPVEVATTFEMVLDGDSHRRRRLRPGQVEIGSLAEGVEPDETSDNNNADCIYQKSVVENDQAEGDVVALDDSCDGDYEGYEQCDSKDCSSSEISLGEDHVHENIGPSPDDRECHCDGTGSKKKEIQGSPNTHKSL